MEGPQGLQVEDCKKKRNQTLFSSTIRLRFPNSQLCNRATGFCSMTFERLSVNILHHPEIVHEALPVGEEDRQQALKAGHSSESNEAIC